MTLGDKGLGVATQIQIDIATLDALDDTVDQLALAVAVGVNHLLAFRLAYTLHDHLLGGLRGNAAELHVVHRLFDHAADLDVGVDGQRVLEQDLVVFRLHFRIVFKHFPATEGLVIARFTVDGYTRNNFIVVTFGRGRCEGGFERFKNDIFADAFLIGYRVYNQKDFFTHLLPTPFRALSPADQVTFCARREFSRSPAPASPW